MTVIATVRQTSVHTKEFHQNNIILANLIATTADDKSYYAKFETQVRQPTN
jgi:hypothetical protein